MGKPIAIVNKMAESVFTQEAQSASSLTQATFPALLQDKFTTGRKNKVRAGSAKLEPDGNSFRTSSQRHRDD